jgi:hypothetical protein
MEGNAGSGHDEAGQPARRTIMARSTTGGVAAALVLALALSATASQARVLEPMVWGWEQIFKLDYQAGEDRGKPVVHGYVINDSPYTITRVQLLVEGLDAGDAVVAQRVMWVPGDFTPFSRRYFEAASPQPAQKYRVRVFAFDRIEAPTRDH